MNRYLRDEMIGKLALVADRFRLGHVKSIAEVKTQIASIVRTYEEMGKNGKAQLTKD